MTEPSAPSLLEADIPPTADTLQAVQAAGEDFEWYPTTDRMIAAVAKAMARDTRYYTPKSLLDVGAGDGRVLAALDRHVAIAWVEREAEAKTDPERYPRHHIPPTPEEIAEWKREELEKAHRNGAGISLYSIEKSLVLAQAQPQGIIPVGTDLFEQNLACLPVDCIFSNPPYSQYEAWASTIIESGHAKQAFLILPQRWKRSKLIAESLKKRGATAEVIHSDDFLNAERRARAVVDIVQVNYPLQYEGHPGERPVDPFDQWFDQNISTFDPEQHEDPDEWRAKEELKHRELARLHSLDSIPAMVEAYNEEYARMEENYKAIFKLDYALLKELGVKKDEVREGIKKKMAGLKAKYWQALFDRLDAITSRLATGPKKKLLERLTERAAVAFTANNAYTIVLWAIKNANQYLGEQLIQLFRDLSTFEGVLNYKSNQRTWQRDGWRYGQGETKNSHYALDYRIVVTRWGAIAKADKWGHVSSYDSPGGLADTCHELIDDIIAVLYNLGFQVSPYDHKSRRRQWSGGQWQNFLLSDEETVLFQVKAYQNGNVHLRFLPDAIKALNVEAGRLLGWLRSPADAVQEMGLPPEEAARFFGANHLLGPSNIKLLADAGGN